MQLHSIDYSIMLIYVGIGFALKRYGSDVDTYKSSLNLNVNLCRGLVLFVFGALMLVFALKDRGAKK